MSLTSGFAQATECGEMQVMDYATAMCMPLPMVGMPMSMLMVHGNGFAVQDFESGGRGREALSGPNMVMADLGTTLADRHYLNLDVMATGELWTFPVRGYPELLQIGETDRTGRPFIDAQHPHSSPIMGLTLSDTVALGSGFDHFKYWFAPRGQSTDGPVAFMHRPTGMINPDPPLGHHVGQDVGHISSTVVGAELRLNDSTFELSTFNGTEPQPTKVDLPIETPNSYAARWTQSWTRSLFSMVSLAYVQNPEPDEPELSHLWRTSASLYFDRRGGFHNALIWGLINGYDGVSALNSFAEEFWLEEDHRNYFGRVEVLQRTRRELEVSQDADPVWISALTAGFSYRIWTEPSFNFKAGASVTCDFLPESFHSNYGNLPVAGRIFVEAYGMKMWDL